jgi:hypothetical protein
MEFRIIPRPTPVHPRELRTVRIDGQSVQSRSPAAAHAPARPQEHAQNPETRSEFAEDHRSAARARKAKRRLRGLFETTRRKMRRAERAYVEPTNMIFCAVHTGPFGRGRAMGLRRSNASYGPMPRSRLAASPISSSS